MLEEVLDVVDYCLMNGKVFVHQEDRTLSQTSYIKEKVAELNVELENKICGKDMQLITLFRAGNPMLQCSILYTRNGFGEVVRLVHVNSIKALELLFFEYHFALPCGRDERER